jgi:hypothetical protein
MSVVPKTQLEKIQWAETHAPIWIANQASIGTSVAEAAAFETKTEAARAALTAAENARDAAKNATLDLQTAIAAMDVAAQGIIKQIRAKAETTNNPGVYALGSIPAPATPAPQGPPGTPNELAAELDGDGSLILTWKCANPVGTQGTIYQVWRSTTGSTGEFTYIGGVGEKKFVDASVPAGATSVCYKIQAVRSRAVGMWATFNVLFGTNEGGAMMASVGETSPKMAA